MAGPALMLLPVFALLNPGYVFYVFAATIETEPAATAGQV
jgi:hypothetical protein